MNLAWLSRFNKVNYLFNFASIYVIMIHFMIQVFFENNNIIYVR